MTAVATKVRKPRVKKLPTVVDNEAVVYGCELPPDSYVKLVTPQNEAVDKNGVGHVVYKPVICANNRESLAGRSLWVHPNGTAYDAYDMIDPIFGRTGHTQCTGHFNWAAYFMASSTQRLEREGWAHVSCGYIMIRKRMMTRRQQDVLEMWAMANGFRGEDFFEKAVQDINERFNDDEET